MNNIAFWYKKINKDKSDVTGRINVNFWKLFYAKQNYDMEILKTKNANYLLDLGIFIDNTSNIEKIYCYIPMDIRDGDFTDLGHLISSDIDIVNGIFNENYNIVQGVAPNQVLIEDGDGLSFVIYSMTEGIHYSLEKRHDGTILEIDITKYNKININKGYFRFRINNKSRSFVKEHNHSNPYFQSAFRCAEIVDVRINEKRNFSSNLAEEISNNDIFKISKYHFLLLRDSEDDVTTYSSNSLSRELEKNIWGNYIGDEYYGEDIIAYHLKSENESGNFLLKEKYYKSNWGTIAVYILTIGLLSIVFNLTSGYIESAIGSKNGDEVVSVSPNPDVQSREK